MKESVSSNHKESLPFDARLLSDAVIELNISRRNVAIYPKNHSLVAKSLDKAFEFLKNLFELRDEITLAVAKDTIIVGDRHLDKKNPVFREFALSLNRNNISRVTFKRGLSREEIYEFQRFLSDGVPHNSKETFHELLKGYHMSHIQLEYIDFGAFSFEELGDDQKVEDHHLWEEYVYGLVHGNLVTDEGKNDKRNGSLSTITEMALRAGQKKEEAYDRVISSYLRRSSENPYSGSELKKLKDYISDLRPEVKKQFLANANSAVSGGADSANTKFRSVDEVIELLSVINDQKVAIPNALNNLLNKLSYLAPENTDVLPDSEGLSPPTEGNMTDDILVSPEIMNLISEGDFSMYVSDEYQDQIDRLLQFDATVYSREAPAEIKGQFSDESIESGFSQTVLDLISSDFQFNVPQKDHEYFLAILKEQAEKFVCNCGYGKILNMISVFKADTEEKETSGLGSQLLEHLNSRKFISYLVSSFRTTERKSIDDAMLLCEYYGSKIVSPLIEALTEEETQRGRRVLMMLICRLGDMAYPELVKHLDDDRWFVKRNMLYMLGKCSSREISCHVRPYARHENPKVRFQAIRVLLNLGDDYAVSALRNLLSSKEREDVSQAIELSGLFRVREAVPDLIMLLRKTAKSGADLSDKIPIVKALGKIGDLRALDTMRGLLASRSLLFKSTLSRLKEEINLALENYPAKDRRDLVKNH
jgi:hypothetical protein